MVSIQLFRFVVSGFSTLPSETGESAKCLWVGVVEGMAGERNRETVTASFCPVFKGPGQILAPLPIK